MDGSVVRVSIRHAQHRPDQLTVIPALPENIGDYLACGSRAGRGRSWNNHAFAMELGCNIDDNPARTKWPPRPLKMVGQIRDGSRPKPPCCTGLVHSAQARSIASCLK